MNKILIIQTAFLGDVILATPVATELKRIFPSSRVDFLLKKGNEDLLTNHPAISHVHVFNKKSGKRKEITRLIREIRSEKYDLIINLHRFASSGLITVLSGAKRRYGFSKNPFSGLYTKKFKHDIGTGQHEVERNLSIISEFGAKTLVRPSLYPSNEDKKKVSVYKNKAYYVFAPASVWFTKQLPPEKWIELSGRIPDDATIYLIGAPTDKDLCDEIIRNSERENMANLCGELSFLQSAALMKDATRNFVNDSGPLHLASAMNAPVTAFFCSTVTSFGFGPLSEDSSVMEVSDLSCRPCGVHGYRVCPLGHFKCGVDMNLSGIQNIS